MAGAQRDTVRITQPMVREGWLADGAGPANGRRGRDRFVPVSHDHALDLVSSEIERLRSTFGNAAIYASSYGWSSAGRFHHAQSQIHRFMRMAGGYADSVDSYSVGAMEVILPHVIGGSGMSIWRRCPTYEEIASYGELVVSFGGMARGNTEIEQGGIADHAAPRLQERCRGAGVRFVNVSPVRSDSAEDLGAEWLPIRPGTDVAMMFGLAYEIVASDRHDRDFLARCCGGFEEFAAYLLGRSDGIPKDAAWASGSPRSGRTSQGAGSVPPSAPCTAPSTPPPGVRTHCEIFSGLAARLGFEDRFTEGRDAHTWVRELYERTRAGLAETVELPPFDEFWERGQVTLPSPPMTREAKASRGRKSGGV